MSRKCDITKKGVKVGNNVSHSKRKTRRRFLPNVAKKSLFSEILQERVRIKVSAHGLRVIEANCGIDNYLLNTRVDKISDDMMKLRKILLIANSKKVNQSAAQ